MDKKSSSSESKQANEKKPRMVRDEGLYTRDDSGGPDFKPYNAKFGDGGKVTGSKGA